MKDPPAKSKEPAGCGAAKGLAGGAANAAGLVGFENPPNNGCPAAAGAPAWAPKTNEPAPALDCGAPNKDGCGEELPPIDCGSSAMLLSSILDWSFTTTSLAIVPFVVEPNAGTELDNPKTGDGGALLLAANGKDPAEPNVNALPEEPVALGPNEKEGEKAPKVKAELVEGAGVVNPEPNTGVAGDCEMPSAVKPPKIELALVDPNAGVLAVDPKVRGAEAGAKAGVGAGVVPNVLAVDAVPKTELVNDGNDGVFPKADNDGAAVLPAEVAGVLNANGRILAAGGKADAVCDAGAELEACPNEGGENKLCAPLVVWLPAAKVAGTTGVAAEVARVVPKVVNV